MLLPGLDVVKNRIFVVERVARTASTQDVVRRAARAGAPDGFCCLAAEQTAGRGRQGRRWQAPPGSAMLASVLLRLPHMATGGLPFAAGLALCDALHDAAAVPAQLKWPNDVLVGGRKLAGILVELDATAGHGDEAAAIVGAGVNLTMDTFPEGADGVSVHQLTPRVPTADALLNAWLERLATEAGRLEAEGLPAVLDRWRQRATGLGESVRAVMGGGEAIEGIAEDVAADGALLIRTADGVARVLAGDVHLQREAGSPGASHPG